MYGETSEQYRSLRRLYSRQFMNGIGNAVNSNIIINNSNNSNAVTIIDINTLADHHSEHTDCKIISQGTSLTCRKKS
jgi:hypothetical protein